jgi:hypothetical protein
MGEWVNYGTEKQIKLKELLLWFSLYLLALSSLSVLSGSLFSLYASLSSMVYSFLYAGFEKKI